MGTFHKVVWPKGKNLKPQPKGRAVSIPLGRSPAQIALPAAKTLLQALPGEPPELLSFNRTWLETDRQRRLAQMAEAMCLRPLREAKAMSATAIALRRQESRKKTPTT